MSSKADLWSVFCPRSLRYSILMGASSSHVGKCGEIVRGVQLSFKRTAVPVAKRCRDFVGALAKLE
jgi:hypothetical protein